MQGVVMTDALRCVSAKEKESETGERERGESCAPQ